MNKQRKSFIAIFGVLFLLIVGSGIYFVSGFAVLDRTTTNYNISNVSFLGNTPAQSGCCNLSGTWLPSGANVMINFTINNTGTTADITNITQINISVTTVGGSEKNFTKLNLTLSQMNVSGYWNDSNNWTKMNSTSNVSLGQVGIVSFVTRNAATNGGMGEGEIASFKVSAQAAANLVSIYKVIG